MSTVGFAVRNQGEAFILNEITRIYSVHGEVKVRLCRGRLGPEVQDQAVIVSVGVLLCHTLPGA